MPGWRRAVARHQPASTILTATARDHTPVSLSYSVVIDKCPDTSNQVWQAAGDGTVPFQGNPSSPSSYSDIVADRHARQQFMRAYRASRTTFESGVALGELAKTVSMLANPARALREGIDAYYRGVKKRLRRRKKPKDRSKIVSDTWLEYMYGWRPLVNDARNAAKLLTAEPYQKFKQLTARASEKWHGEVDNTSFYSPSLITYRVRCWQENEVSVRYIGAIGAENSPPGFPEQLGLSWSNVLPTAWELIPYSFLVDYFSNVGDVIAGASTGNIHLAWGNKTVRKQSSQHVECYMRAEGNNLGYPLGKRRAYVSGGGQTAMYKDVDRMGANNLSFGLADTRFQLPEFASLKWLNIAALLHMRT